MAYFTGTASNPADLLLKLKSHAESIGWNTDRSSADEWCCHNNDGYWSIKAFNNRLELRGSTGFNNSAAWNHQPGSFAANESTYSKLAATPFVAYHLFATEDYLHAVIEIASGAFSPLFIGTLDKRGAVYDGGQYVGGFVDYYANGTRYFQLNHSSARYPFDGYSSSHLKPYASRVRVDGQDGAPSPNWLWFNQESGSHYACGLGRGYYYSSEHPASLLVETSANSLTGGTLLIPCTIYTIGAGSRTRMIGEVKDFAVCRMDYLSAGDTVTVGSDTWRVFPPIERTALDNQGSGMVGYAYKVVA